jgi:hypothetical protein
MYTDKISAKEFFRRLRNSIDEYEPHFTANLAVRGDMTFCDWMSNFIAWSEWSTKDDCEWSDGGWADPTFWDERSK